MKTLLSAALAALVLSAGAAQGAELLTNGAFDAGASGFYSAYRLAATHDLWPEGTYDVIANPQADHRRFASMADHTPGPDSNLMMVINGSPMADTVIWSEGDIGGGTALGGAANADFTFSFWLATVYPTSPANLQLWINGAKVQGVTFAATAALGTWRQFAYAGVSGADGLHSISLTNNNLAPFGNDFALDDLSLDLVAPPPPVQLPPVTPPTPGSPPEPPLSLPDLGSSTDAPIAVPEPAGWLLMIVGFGALGEAVRRRRAQGGQAVSCGRVA